MWAMEASNLAFRNSIRYGNDGNPLSAQRLRVRFVQNSYRLDGIKDFQVWRSCRSLDDPSSRSDRMLNRCMKGSNYLFQ